MEHDPYELLVSNLALVPMENFTRMKNEWGAEIETGKPFPALLRPVDISIRACLK